MPGDGSVGGSGSMPRGVIRALIPGVDGTIPGDVEEDPGGWIEPCCWGGVMLPGIPAAVAFLQSAYPPELSPVHS